MRIWDKKTIPVDTSFLSAHARLLDDYNNVENDESYNRYSDKSLENIYKGSTRITPAMYNFIEFTEAYRTGNPEIYALIVLKYAMKREAYDLNTHAVSALYDAFVHFSQTFLNSIEHGMAENSLERKVSFYKRRVSTFLKVIKDLIDEHALHFNCTHGKEDADDAYNAVHMALERCVDNQIPFVTYFIMIMHYMCDKKFTRIDFKVDVNDNRLQYDIRCTLGPDDDIANGPEYIRNRIKRDTEYMHHEMFFSLMMMKQYDRSIRFGIDHPYLNRYYHREATPSGFIPMLLFFGYDLEYDITKFFDENILSRYFSNLNTDGYTRKCLSELYSVCKYLSEKDIPLENKKYIDKRFNLLKLIK